MSGSGWNPNKVDDAVNAGLAFAKGVPQGVPTFVGYGDVAELRADGAARITGDDVPGGEAVVAVAPAWAKVGDCVALLRGSDGWMILQANTEE